MPKYSDAYRVWAVETALERDSVREAANMAGVSQTALRRWIKDYESGSLSVNGGTAALLYGGADFLCSNCLTANPLTADECSNCGAWFVNGKACKELSARMYEYSERSGKDA